MVEIKSINQKSSSVLCYVQINKMHVLIVNMFQKYWDPTKSCMNIFTLEDILPVPSPFLFKTKTECFAYKVCVERNFSMMLKQSSSQHLPLSQ